MLKAKTPIILFLLSRGYPNHDGGIMQESYRTLQAFGYGELIVHKSRFIGYGMPCGSEDEALAFLDRVRLKHKDASHNCYAYIIGSNAGIMRYSDDGEPAGTAGLPIMGVLQALSVVNCAIVVTRYFGGTLLGTGGLVRAYTQATQDAVKASGIVRMCKSKRLLVEVTYSCWQRLDHYLQHASCLLMGTQFQAAVVATILTRLEDEQRLITEIERISDGRAEILEDDEFYYPWPDDSGQA